MFDLKRGRWGGCNDTLEHLSDPGVLQLAVVVCSALASQTAAVYVRRYLLTENQS